jgi:hypothetical protein
MSLKTPNRHAARCAFGAVLAIAAATAAAGAHEARTSFTVSAAVNAYVRIEAQSAPEFITLTAADIEHGFIEIEQPTALAIRGNSVSGFALDVATLTSMLSSMVVHGFDAELRLGSDGGTIVQRWQSPHEVRLTLRFTLFLAPGLVPGRYPWPMRISARPLESI